MLTRKQQQGFKILESIVQSEYPFVVTLSPSFKHHPNTYATTFGVVLTIDPVTLSKYLDLPLAKKFTSSPYLWNYYLSIGGEDLGYVVHLFDDEYQDITGWKFNSKMESFINKAYSQLPSTMRVNIYSHHPEDEIPTWALGQMNSPRTLSIDNIMIAKDSNVPKYED